MEKSINKNQVQDYFKITDIFVQKEYQTLVNKAYVHPKSEIDVNDAFEEFLEMTHSEYGDQVGYEPSYNKDLDAYLWVVWKGNREEMVAYMAMNPKNKYCKDFMEWMVSEYEAED